MADVPLRLRVQIAVTRVVTRMLKVLGLREAVLRTRLRRARRVRLAAGADDPVVRPALHDMDRKLDALFDKDAGTFCEAGGNDGYTQSNTYWLERFRGWRGVLVEPMPELYELCLEERPNARVVQAALVPSDHRERTVRMVFGDLMSTVSGEHEIAERTRMGTIGGWRDRYEADVPARTLTSILDEADLGELDLLSLDVEGYEAQALSGLDLDRHAPRYVLVEIHDEANGRPPIEAALGDRYELADRLSPMDYLYRRRDGSA